MLGQGTKPTGKPLPNRVGQFEGENLQDAQGNGMEIDKALEGFDLVWLIQSVWNIPATLGRDVPFLE